MKKYILVLFCFIPLYCLAQSLGQVRIDRLDNSVVRIMSEYSDLGTGFVIHDSGWIATCFHVIEPVLIRDTNTNQITGFDKLFAEFSNGEGNG